MKRFFIIFVVALLSATALQAQSPHKEINPIGFKLIYDGCSTWASKEGKSGTIKVMQIPGEVIQRAAKSEQDKALATRIQETYQITVSPRGSFGCDFIHHLRRKLRHEYRGDSEHQFNFKELYKQRMEQTIAHRKCYIYHRPANDFYPQEWLVVIDDGDDSKEPFAKSKEPFVMTCLVGDELTIDDVLTMMSGKK